MAVFKLPPLRKGIHARILIPAVIMTVTIGVITVLVSSKIITGSIESRASEYMENNDNLFSQILMEQEEKVAFYSQFMADMVKLSRQISGTPTGRSMLIYLLESLEREGIKINIYRSKFKFEDARQILIQKGYLGIRATGVLELNRKNTPYMAMVGVSPVERKEGITEVVLATHEIDEDFLNNIKNKTGADLYFFYSDGSVLSTLKDSACVERIREVFVNRLGASVIKEFSDRTITLNCGGNPQKIIFKPHIVNLNAKGVYALSVPMSDLLMARKQLTLQVVLMMVFMLSLIIIIYSLVVRRIVHPIQDLSEATEKVARGDLTQSIDIRSGDELGELGYNFNRMIMQLYAARTAMEALHTRQMERAERLAVLGQMASGVAHEFNNILAIVLANAQLLLRSMGKDTKALRRINAIEQAAKDGAQTVQRMQEFARVRKDETFIYVDLNQVLSDVVEATRPRWKVQSEREGHPVEMDVRLGDTMPVSGNPAELREVITNLIFNALDAMPRGGKIIIETKMDNNEAVMTFADTGIGMSPEVQQRVFDPFFTTKEFSSSGLGLSVSYGIISRHGGEILVDSVEGQGTVFTLRLPLSERKDEEAATEVVSEIHHSAKVLIIDDEQGILDALSDSLSAMGHEVSTAGSGKEGLEKFDKKKYDVVFTDLGMPDMNGWEVARAIKQISPKTPVAMITGWHMELKEDKMKREGVDLVITKPFEMDSLQRVMAEALSLKSKM